MLFLIPDHTAWKEQVDPEYAESCMRVVKFLREQDPAALNEILTWMEEEFINTIWTDAD